ncbi:hypothetical protein PPTG_20783 [Phytophthora nicotianae INRA-310]|uniref:Uncharacterized protein n=1 Tax=Phytophthora nicotianae (strain INRA-310) TaxID=761204 RepID=W2RIF3_PHYN3|nr:hypothetical protein PPTG_20783 [Phytophthora nicotianae INRA-310]ETN24350.1 hypothetical protein PPTG_20783 [Phytophthora nicotianae INRA-310]
MSTLLHDWDEGSKSKRKKLLEWFCSNFDPTQNGGGQLESEYGADIALFLPRLLSWMHKTVASAMCTSNDTCNATSKPGKVKCFALTEQVACLHVVFGSANAHEYYREFQHADGLQLVLKIVAIYGTAPHSQTPLVSVTDRETLFRIILRISKMSRQCKEDISCLDGELAVIRGVLASGEINDWKAESRVWTLCREILLEQLVGNPNSLDRAHEAVAFMLRHSEVRLRLFGAQVLRELISEKSFSFDPEYRRRKEYDLVPLCLSLLESADVYLQHESLELLHALLQSKHLQETICEKLVRLVGDSAKALDAKVEERFALIEDTTEHETYAHLRSAFTAASQAVNTLMNSNRNMLPILVDRYDLLTPLAFVLAVERPHSLKWHAAAISIQFIISHYYPGAAPLIGELFEVSVDELLEWKDKRGDDGTMLAEFLLGDEDHRSHLALLFYQRQWYRPLFPRKQFEQADSDRILNDIEQNVETAARDYVPELQVQTRVGENSDETEEMDILEAQREHHLRVQLQKHFAKFRHIPTAVTTTSSN